MRGTQLSQSAAEQRAGPTKSIRVGIFPQQLLDNPRSCTNVLCMHNYHIVSAGLSNMVENIVLVNSSTRSTE